MNLKIGSRALVASAVSILAVSGLAACSDSADQAAQAPFVTVEATEGTTAESTTSSSKTSSSKPSSSESSSKEKKSSTSRSVQAAEESAEPAPAEATEPESQKPECTLESLHSNSEYQSIDTILNCEGGYMRAGQSGTDHLAMFEFREGQWHIIMKDGGTRSGVPCYTRQNLEQRGFPASILDQAHLC